MATHTSGRQSGGSARVIAHNLYTWIKRYSVPAEQRAERDSQADEIRRLKAELRRATEERDILKKAAAYFAKQSG